MKNTANKVWTKVKNIKVTITGKIKSGFIEIAVAPLNTCRLVAEPVFIWLNLGHEDKIILQLQ